MPRHLFSINVVSPASTAAKALLSGASFLLFCTLAVVACAAHGRPWPWYAVNRRRHREPIISVHQVQPGDDDECVWKRSIIMGEKCQLPDFSGAIFYDSTGNLVAPGSADRAETRATQATKNINFSTKAGTSAIENQML
ncbi:hypothetical protein HPP92_000633 [Vanilla planifolia]|uniref:Uncharacterized protein n=1 Tax=Vanilla planifolia TaxID=51239 RepID=A0A835S1S2_VANPL|nr:hypothetical protein HPP92_000633 [Vanilla planifolia]